MTYTESLGDKVRNKRINLSLTQEELSQRTGLSTGHISDIENGKRPYVQGKTIKKLARGLNMTLTEILGDPSEEETDGN